MKKTLIALAALAATVGVAHAQSSVTVYGVVDAYVGQTNTKVQSSTADTSLSQTVQNGSGLSSSRWGLRGSEDLGGGLAAVFTLESGFGIDTGALANNGGSSSSTASILFGRTASVGLKGNFGEVRLGRQYTAYDTLRGATNNTYDSNTFATTGTIWGVGLQDYSNRANNAIRYDSPVFSGFSGSLMYAFGEDKTTTASASSSASAHIKYAAGPLLVGYAYQAEKSNGTANSTLFSGAAGLGSTVIGSASANVGSAGVVTTRKYNLLGATYDFGVAKLVGSYNTAKGLNTASQDTKDKEYQIGVSVPFGAASIAAGYTRAKSDFANTSRKGTGYSLLGTYDLSKRTTLYTGYTNMKGEPIGDSTRTDKQTLFAAGIRHTF